MEAIIICGKCGKQSECEEIVAFARYKCKTCQTVNEVLDVNITEWLGFNYSKYLQDILKTIKADNFENLKANNLTELNNGYLSAEQITKLKQVFVNAFRKGNTIREIVSKLKSEVGINSLKYIDANDIERVLDASTRTLMIARTESTRLANLGSINYYKANGFDNYTWIASNDERTCEDCWSKNGVVYSTNSGERPPQHILCRCSTAPVTDLSENL